MSETGRKVERVLVHTEDVTEAALQGGEEEMFLRAIRAYREGDEDLDTLEVRHSRLNAWAADGSHNEYEVFAGWRTPAGGGEGERWSGRNYWVHVYYGAA